MQSSVAIAVSDLMFQPRVATAVEGLGLTAVIADTPETLARAIADGPRLLVVRAAGADKVVPRSQLVEELPELIAALIGAHSH
jgi:hypothetical protein